MDKFAVGVINVTEHALYGVDIYGNVKFEYFVRRACIRKRYAVRRDNHNVIFACVDCGRSFVYRRVLTRSFIIRCIYNVKRNQVAVYVINVVRAGFVFVSGVVCVIVGIIATVLVPNNGEGNDFYSQRTRCRGYFVVFEKFCKNACYNADFIFAGSVTDYVFTTQPLALLRHYKFKKGFFFFLNQSADFRRVFGSGFAVVYRQVVYGYRNRFLLDCESFLFLIERVIARAVATDRQLDFVVTGIDNFVVRNGVTVLVVNHIRNRKVQRGCRFDVGNRSVFFAVVGQLFIRPTRPLPFYCKFYFFDFESSR